MQQRTAEVTEALKQQKASAEVLEVISNSVADTKPVFEKILESCQRLIPCCDLAILPIDDTGCVETAAVLGKNVERIADYRPTPMMDSVAVEAIQSRRLMHYPDALNGVNAPESIRRMALRGENCPCLIAPMVWQGKSVGAFFLSRILADQDWPTFSQKDMDLLQSFADQAVIAIQNARLFSETQTALVRQTASAEILEVISGAHTDASQVFETIAKAALPLLECFSVVVGLFKGDGFFPRSRGDRERSPCEPEPDSRRNRPCAQFPLSGDRVTIHGAYPGLVKGRPARA